MLTLLANSSTFPTVPIFRNSLPESYVAISLASSHDCTLVKPFGQVNIAERVMLCLTLTPARARTKASPDLAYTGSRSLPYVIWWLVGWPVAMRGKTGACAARACLDEEGRHLCPTPPCSAELSCFRSLRMLSARRRNLI